MWCPTEIPNFSGDFPFLRHVQFWLHFHNKYQEAYELPPTPFVVLSWYTPGTIPPSPDLLFCPINHIPSPEAIRTAKCPLILAPNTFRDIKIEHYGVVIGIDPTAIVPHPISYP